MPIKDRALVEPAMERKLPPPAPYLINGVCSDCAVEPIICADGSMQACPKCYGVLWHRDHSAEERAAREHMKEVMKERAMVARRANQEAKLRAKLGAHVWLGFDGRDHRC
jgi:hypothetical protein